MPSARRIPSSRGEGDAAEPVSSTAIPAGAAPAPSRPALPDAASAASDPFADLDAVDLAILDELEHDGRISNTELARRVGVAESTCLKRVRALVASGAIVGFHAEVDPAARGLHLEALITIRLHAHARGDLRRFQAYLERLPATRRVYFVAGDRDFLLHVAVRDTRALRELVSDTLSLHPEVAATSTSLIFEHAPGRPR
ncbi:Lrp/AsnC family transcriptional regulator [Microbacterium sp. No. 7]|uniref:Lrp/AsnC family transcriptional regulator n=1 Tax=Microbacterium sp. No. 7 TaxID=1714373 RepID=UPI0006ED1BED|nr:Lrp/AsnC family transcriptional regulator [Microbacterium sp. No. 7]ALJ18672.1 AsnC family transcriptional regulator [Microbacterium sp. No. 7]